MQEKKSEKLKFVRYEPSDGNSYYGIVKNNTILQLSGSFPDIVAGDLTEDGVKYKYEEVNLLTPVIPSKVILFGWTYAKHALETGGEANLKEPLLLLKPPSTLIPNQSEIHLPPLEMTHQVELEGEVAVIIGKQGKNIAEANALDYVFGYTILNDVTARDLTKTDPQFTRGKGFDTFGPLGPCIVKGLNPENLELKTTLNNTIVQHANTNQMSLSIPFLISWVSQIMTLEPGDVLGTGSPSGSRPMKSGDIVTVEFDQIGRLSNKVK